MPELAPEFLPLQRLYHWERARADQIVFTQPLGNEDIHDYTWAQAMAEVRSVARYLQSFGWEPGTRIAILSKNCAHWLMSDFAIWMAGYVSVPIYPTLTAASIRQILEHSDARACFVGKLDGWPDMESGIPEGVECISYPLSPHNSFPTWERIVAHTEPLSGQPVRPADDLATIVYTSGTTGVPKGVMHNFASIAHAPQAVMKLLKCTPEDRVLSYLPLAHVAERFLVEALQIQVGFQVFFAESLDTFLADLRRARPTIFLSVPRLWTKFQQGVLAKVPKERLDMLFRVPMLGRVVKRKILRELGLDTVRYAASGAAALAPEILQWYRDLGLELLEGYGMTENFGFSHASQPGLARVGYVGYPWSGVDVRLSESGEILVKSPCTMLGYFKAPELTAEVFSADGYLRTGDVGEMDAQGRLRITGRAKEQFKTSKGKYVAPTPIENRLVGHPKVEACCVTGVDFPQPFALLMLAEGEWAHCRDAQARAELTASLHALLRGVNLQLDPHEQLDFLVVVPEQWTVENELITPTLKIKRAAVEQYYGRHFAAWAAQKQPVVWHEG